MRLAAHDLNATPSAEGQKSGVWTVTSPQDMPVTRRMEWTPEAEARIKEVPFFVRPAVRRRIESLALEASLTSIDLDFYCAAKARFGEK